jgi:hypothetical protein
MLDSEISRQKREKREDLQKMTHSYKNVRTSYEDGMAAGRTSMRADFGELITEIQDVDERAGLPLGTARWMGPREAHTG